jgi:hypothetical protein
MYINWWLYFFKRFVFLSECIVFVWFTKSSTGSLLLTLLRRWSVLCTFFISYNAWYINTLASSRIDIYPNLIQCKSCNITITLDKRFFTVYNLRLTFFNNTTSRFNRIDQETNKNNTKITWQIQVVLVEFNEQLSAQLHSIIYWMIFISQWVNLFQLILNWHLYQIATRHCNF